MTSLMNAWELSRDGVGNTGKLAWSQTVGDLSVMLKTSNFVLWALGSDCQAFGENNGHDDGSRSRIEQGEIHLLSFFSRQ